jgi:hypothetical protein
LNQKSKVLFTGFWRILGSLHFFIFIHIVTYFCSSDNISSTVNWSSCVKFNTFSYIFSTGQGLLTLSGLLLPLKG